MRLLPARNYIGRLYWYELMIEPKRVAPIEPGTKTIRVPRIGSRWSSSQIRPEWDRSVTSIPTSEIPISLRVKSLHLPTVSPPHNGGRIVFSQSRSLFRAAESAVRRDETERDLMIDPETTVTLFSPLRCPNLPF